MIISRGGIGTSHRFSVMERRVKGNFHARCDVGENPTINIKGLPIYNKILISVVVGALLLAGLYMLFQDTILPELSKRITELFDYKG